MRQHATRDNGKSGDTTKKASADTATTSANSSLMTPYSFAGMNVFPFPGATVSGEVVNPLPPIDRGAVVLMPSIALGYEVKGGLKGTPVFVSKDGATVELQNLVGTISYSVDPKGGVNAISFSSKVPGLPHTSVSYGFEGIETGTPTLTWSTSSDVATFSDGKKDFSGTIQLTLRIKIVPKPRVPEPEPVLAPSWIEDLGKRLLVLLEIIGKGIVKAAYFIAAVVLIVLWILALSIS